MLATPTRHPIDATVYQALFSISGPLLRTFPTKISRMEENFGAVDVQLTEGDLKKIEDATSKLSLEGTRLPEAMLKMTGL
jgi:hypothetical protein